MVAVSTFAEIPHTLTLVNVMLATSSEPMERVVTVCTLPIHLLV